MTPRKRFFKLQWNLRTMFLLTAVVAVWVPFFLLQQKIERTAQKIVSMRRMARELIVDDTSKIAIVKKQGKRSDENRWEIYLPDGEYALRLATRKIDDVGLAPAAGETRIRGGMHLVELLQSKDKKGHEISILLDDKPVIETRENKDWKHGNNSTGGGHFDDCTQLPLDGPVVLFRRRFHYEVKPGQTTTPDGPSEGLLLWIDRGTEEKEKNEGKSTPLDSTPPSPPAQKP